MCLKRNPKGYTVCNSEISSYPQREATKNKIFSSIYLTRCPERDAAIQCIVFRGRNQSPHHTQCCCAVGTSGWGSINGRLNLILWPITWLTVVSSRYAPPTSLWEYQSMNLAQPRSSKRWSVASSKWIEKRPRSLSYCENLLIYSGITTISDVILRGIVV